MNANEKFDLAPIAIAHGVELSTAGPGRLRGLCPFHRERTPSFFVFEAQNRFKCFGCGERGDAIDFVRRTQGLSYPEALRFLGVDRPQVAAQRVREMQRKRQERLSVEWNERELTRTLGIAIRRCHEALHKVTHENFDSPMMALILDQLAVLEFQHSVLIHGDPADRAALVRELSGLRLFTRRLLFSRNFDYSGWLRGVRNNRGANDERRPGGTGCNTTGIRQAL